MNQNVTTSPVSFQETDQVTCTSPWYVEKTEYHPVMATYQPLVNGEEAFEAVHLAIAEATKSVDIICWGFQPSMYFIRDGNAPMIGELLKKKAKEGVKVRVLGWEYPFNAAGGAGEANLPGKGPVRIMDRKMQRSTEDQYAYDREWFDTCAVVDNPTLLLKGDPIPLYASRGFSAFERAEIVHQAKFHGLDAELSTGTLGIFGAAPSHHQKTVLVDYEVPDRAVGFVMGHNMLDEYWDTDAHSALNRAEGDKPKPNVGPRGDTPRQDISCKVSGPILEHLHHNFATAWHKETNQDLLEKRQAKSIGPQLQLIPGATRQLAQLVRTQPQEGKRDIERLYLQAVNNATQFIYIENQYFRWPPLAELIKQVAQGQTKWGRDPGVHGALHLFVITNATDDGMGAGTVNTQRMLESLGRANTIPEVTKLRRIEQIKTDPATRAIHPQDRPAQERLEKQIKDIEESTIVPQDIPNLKVHICSLVADNSPAGKDWMPVYIHSKLMIIDDVFTTHGSANINTRSMQVDSEMNIAHEWASVTESLRRRLWNLHTKGQGAQDDPAVAFDEWGEIMKDNGDLQENNQKPCASLVEFYYGKNTLKDLD
ncbi:phospholipase D-like domain-containing protein [Pseudomonas syringae]|uniref:Phospholipase n=1 Tax=Pseudomonas syringae TaxID=317 RepID=A0A085V9G0_PSESX|nr:phosphatidylserine/phosphatidylglycerophosphate/cardiolipin synthase family protein [Pseudomonas syringae]KFE52073.1 phospholipase [Pseudomonas syringae]